MTPNLITQVIELLEESLKYGKDSSVREALRMLKEESQASDDGWIPWSGGECPVSANTKVEVKWDCGKVVEKD